MSQRCTQDNLGSRPYTSLQHKAQLRQDGLGDVDMIVLSALDGALTEPQPSESRRCCQGVCCRVSGVAAMTTGSLTCSEKQRPELLSPASRIINLAILIEETSDVSGSKF